MLYQLVLCCKLILFKSYITFVYNHIMIIQIFVTCIENYFLYIYFLFYVVIFEIVYMLDTKFNDDLLEKKGCKHVCAVYK